MKRWPLPDGEIYRAQAAAKQHRQAKGPSYRKEITIGDMVTIDDPEVPTFGSRRQHAFTVTAVRGKVVRVQERREGCRQPAPIRTFHVERLHVVPPDVEWDRLNPRVFRSRRGPDSRMVAHPESAAQATIESTAGVAAGTGNDSVLAS